MILVGKAKFVTALDLACEYWQVPVADEGKIDKRLYLLAPLVCIDCVMLLFGLNGAPPLSRDL